MKQTGFCAESEPPLASTFGVFYIRNDRFHRGDQQIMALSQELLDILVCPESKQALVYFADDGFLFCPASRLKYRIEDDIPVMLVDEAERLDETAAQALMATAPPAS